MIITRNNYESYFLDYHEGNLPDMLKKELFLFLESNHDLREEFESIELISVPVPDKKFLNKDALKKNVITINNYKTWFIGYIENDLDANEKRELDRFIERNPSLKPELEIFKQARVVPDHSILFENKKQLKHSLKIIPFTPQMYRIAVAATVALLLIAYFYFRNNKEQFMAHHSTGKPETKQEALPLTQQTVNPDPDHNNKNKNGVVNGNRSKEKSSFNKKSTIPVKIKQLAPLNENQLNEPLLTQHDDMQNQNLEKKENSIEQAEFSPELSAENKTGNRNPFQPTSSQLSEVFSNDELRELGMSHEFPQKEKTTLWDLASKGAGELGKITGTEISLNQHRDDLKNTNSFALAIGNFSISHISCK